MRSLAKTQNKYHIDENILSEIVTSNQKPQETGEIHTTLQIDAVMTL